MAKASKSTGTMVMRDGVNIFYMDLYPEVEKGRIVIAHGLGEHSGRYLAIAELLADLGLAVRIMDHRGHGQSDGKRGHVESFADYVTDLRLIVEGFRGGLATGQKMFLLGHSMGGLRSTYFGIKFPELLDGLVVSSPGLGLVIKVPAYKSLMANMLSNIMPGTVLDNEIDTSKLSHDKDVVKSYGEDPLVHSKVSARWYMELLSAIKIVNSLCSEFKLPILMQIAGDDYLSSSQSSKEFFRRLSTEDKTMHLYDDYYHEVYNETKDRREVAFKDLKSWIAERL